MVNVSITVESKELTNMVEKQNANLNACIKWLKGAFKAAKENERSGVDIHE